MFWRQQKHQCLCFDYWEFLTNFWRNNWRSIFDVLERLCFWVHLQYSNFVVNFHWNQLMVGPWTINGTFHIFFQIKVFQSHLEKTRTTIYLCKTMWEIMRIGSAGLLMGDDIGSGLSSMAICFGFRSTNVVQLSIRNPLFNRFQCHYP